MAPILRWRKVLQITLICALSFVVALVAYVQIQRRLIRHRAENLLADLRALQEKKTTWQDAQGFIARWQPYNVSDGHCASTKCEFQVLIEVPITAHLWSLADRHPPLRVLALLYTLFDPHAAWAGVTLEIQDSVMVRSRFYLNVEVIDRFRPNLANSYMLIGRAEHESVTLGPTEYWDRRSMHPEYLAGGGGGCTGCVKFVTRYTTLAGKEKIRELTDFNFDCMSGWSACTEIADIMPNSWKASEAESQNMDARREAYSRCDIPLEFIGSQSLSVVTADISDVTQVEDSRGVATAIRIRDIRTVQGQATWRDNGENGIGEFSEIKGWKLAKLVKGRRYILAGDVRGASNGDHSFVINECGLIPYTEQNLTAIQRGFDEATARSRKLRELGFTSDE